MKRAEEPGEITRIVLEYIMDKDIDGIVSMYEENAIFVKRDGTIAKGRSEIRKVYAAMMAQHPNFEGGEIRPAIINGDIALTSSRLADGRVTAEIARKQSDGYWLWYLDQPFISVP